MICKLNRHINGEEKSLRKISLFVRYFEEPRLRINKISEVGGEVYGTTEFVS